MAWCLVANTGMLHILQQDLMLIGRDQCDISIQSRSVDKQHSVIAYDRIDATHSIKDVGSLNGTFVNDSRIPEETYIQLKKGDSIRFGYDPITYRFDSLQLDNISVVKGQEGFIKQAFLTRQSPPDYNQSLRRAMQKRNAKESRNTYGKQASLQDHRPAAHGSPLYGQPAWWGESEDPSPDGSTSPDDLRPRANTFSTQGSSDDNRPLESPSPHERPSRLPSNEPERDIPVVIYNCSDRRPTQQETPPPRPQAQAEITLMASSEKAIGFTIDFGSSDNGAPKIARPDSLQNCIPKNMRQKIEKSSRMMEELKAERLMKKSQEEEAVMQSPRASPLSSRTDAWSGAGPGGRRTPKGTPETPSPGYQGDVNFQQMQRKNKSSNCLSEPLPPAHLRQRTFVKSSQKTKPNRGSPSPITPTTPVSPGVVDTEEEDSQYQDDIDVEVEGGGGDDVSEAGTYTIESDSQEVEGQEAKERVDQEFGVGEEEEKVPSDDDTDKDVGDEEMEEEEEEEQVVFAGKQNGRSRLDKSGPGLRVRGDGSSRTAVDKIEDIEGKLKGGPGTPQWVQQWATMTTNSALPHSNNPERTQQHLSPDRHDVSPDHIIEGYEAEHSSRISDRDDHLSKKPPSGTRVQTSTTPRTAPPQSPDSAGPRGSRGKRILPNTPAENLQTARQSSTSSSSEQTMRQNGFQASNTSAFHSPRNHAIEQQQQQQQQEQQRYPQERTMEEKAFGKRRQLHGSSDPIAPMGYQQEEEARRDSWGPEGNMDTDVLLKDTETLMRNLEERMRTKRQDTPSPEMSDSHEMPHDISQDISVVSFEADVDTDVDTVSNVSLVGGNNTWAGSKSRHYSCPEDNITPEQTHYTNGRQKAVRSTEKPRPTQADAHSRTSSDKATPAPAKGGGIWSRLSTPNKHKMSAAEKEAEAVSDSDHSFRRNTHLTGSLPTGRISNRSVSKGTSENTKAVKKPKSLKPPNLSQPRQTRSTMLRKSRFSEDSGADHSDISPASSMSDLSSSKNFRRGGSMRETRSGAVSDSGRRTPGERGRGRTSASNARNGDSSARTDHSLGSQIARHARTQSMQDQKMKTAEPRSRLPTSASHNRTPSGNLSRKSSIGSTDSNVSAVRKTSTGAWRRYDTADDSDHDVDSYIKNVNTRRTITQNHQSEERQAPVIQRQKSSSLQNLQTSATRTSPTRKPPNLRVEIAQASNTLAQNLQRLAQGESIDEIKIDRIPKEQLIFHFVQMMDELLVEDSIHLSRQDIWQGERHPQVPLQRSSSLSFQPDQTSQGLAGSPPVHVKKKQFNKSESFDSLVLSSIHHLSIKMKDSGDKIAYKLKKLQQPGASEDELSKVLRDSEFPLLKTNNKEIAGILQNLRKMEKRLEEIHGMVDPRNEIKLPEQLSPVNQMRRQYATEFNFATASDSETPLAMSTRHVGRAPVNANLQRQRHAQQQQQQQQQQQYQEHDEEEEYYL